MSGLLADFRFGIRMLIRRPALTVAALASLALAIGLCTVIFSLVDGVLLQPLPVPDAQALVRIGATERGAGFTVLSYPELERIRRDTTAFDGLIAERINQVALAVDGTPHEAWVEAVSDRYFAFLGIRPALGRGLLDRGERAEDGSGDAVAVLGDRFWRHRLAGDRGVVGRRLTVNGHPFTVVGVAPPGFRGTFPGLEADFWVPLTTQPLALPRDGALADHRNPFLNVIGRLRPGVSRDQARAQLATVALRLAETWPQSHGERGLTTAPATGVHPGMKAAAGALLSVLSAIVTVVLLIACSNLANLLLAAAAARRRELAVRLALGARRARLVRQLLVESALLGVLGALGGLLAASWALRLLSAFRPTLEVPLSLDLSVDLRVIAFAAALGLATCLLFGLLPALRASRTEVIAALRGSVHSDSRRRRAWARNGLVIVQVAASALLLAVAALLLRSLANSRHLDPGFARDDVWTVRLDPGILGYDERRASALWQTLETAIGALPGVTATGFGKFIHLGSGSDRLAILPADGAQRGDATPRRVHYSVIDPGFLPLLGIPVVRGRGLQASDRAGGEEVALVNETTAAHLWPAADAVGRPLRVQGEDGERLLTVAGVVRDVKYRRLNEPPTPFLYLPAAQWPQTAGVLHVRTAAGSNAAAAAITARLRTLAPELPFTLRRLADETSTALIAARVTSAVLTLSGAIGLLLAAIGIFGVVSFRTSRRSREIGIRMALGAGAARVRWMVLAGSLGITAAGLAIGLPLAFAASRALRSFLYGIGPGDPATHAAIAVLLAAVALAAAYPPARRASAIDPAAALRRE